MPTTTLRLATIGSMLAVAATVVAVGVPTPALAGNERRAACTSDVFRLCNNEVPRVDHMISCLRKSRAVLSPGCRATVGDKK